MVSARTWIFMGIFLTAIASLSILFFKGLYTAFMVNPYLNGFIASTLVVGVGYGILQMVRMHSAAKWLQTHEGFEEFGFPRSKTPTLLTDLGLCIDEAHGHFSPSHSEAQSVCDKVVTRVESGRDINRYIMGSLIFLGLLGTFWGLSLTVNGIMGTISGLHVTSADPNTAFEQIKAGLQSPLSGMGTAFTSSLFGLAGFVIFGFIELLVNGVRRRFVNTFESWLNQFVVEARAPLRSLPYEGDQNMPYSTAVLNSMVESLETLNNAIVKENDHNRALKENIQLLADRMSALTDQVRTEQMLMMKLAEGQLALQNSLQKLNEAALNGELGFDKASRGHIRTMSRAVSQLTDMMSSGDLTKDVRQELRVLSKTIGLTGNSSNPGNVNHPQAIEPTSVDVVANKSTGPQVGHTTQAARKEWEERRSVKAAERAQRPKLSSIFKS